MMEAGLTGEERRLGRARHGMYFLFFLFGG